VLDALVAPAVSAAGAAPAVSAAGALSRKLRPDLFAGHM